jgi:hypothetical protein
MGMSRRVAESIVAIGLLACSSASAEKPQEARDAGRGLRQCSDITGYLYDDSPAARAVHARPDPTSPVLGRVAAPDKDPNGVYDVAVGFDILASSNGWLLIEGAADDTALTERPPRAMYSGRGWIRSERVGVGLQTSQAFAQPRHSSAMLVRAIEPNSLPDLVEIAACDGHWVLARWRPSTPPTIRYERAAVISAHPLTLEAWATGICNIQETSCDGVSGDRPAAGAK